MRLSKGMIAFGSRAANIRCLPCEVYLNSVARRDSYSLDDRDRWRNSEWHMANCRLHFGCRLCREHCCHDSVWNKNIDIVHMGPFGMHFVHVRLNCPRWHDDGTTYRIARYGHCVRMITGHHNQGVFFGCTLSGQIDGLWKLHGFIQGTRSITIVMSMINATAWVI